MKIRPARVEDSQAIAPLVYSSAVDDHDYMLRTTRHSATDFIAFACRENCGIWSYSICSVVDVDGKVAATIASYPWKDAPALILSGFGAMIRFYGFWSGLGVIGRCLKIGLRFKPIPKQGIYIANLGTSPEYRGKGFATALYEYLHALWKEQGMTQAVIDVADDNHGSRRILDRLGYLIPEKAQGKAAKNHRMYKML
jgi:ribosomal protein S18 acetylase RimI-like enzyme